MTHQFDKRVVRFWYAKRGVLAWFLSPFAVLYWLYITARRLFFQMGWLSRYEPSVPVIVVGNITVGGVGKTPVVAALARYFMDKGRSVGIVSRGYGGSATSYPLEVTNASDPAVVGDEPVMLACQLGCFIAVSPNRSEAIQLCERHGCDLILSDDGLAHYRFKPAFECVVVDQSRGLGNGFCLPVGPLREPASRLQSAAMVLSHTSRQCDKGNFFLAPLEYVSLNGSVEAKSLCSFEGIVVHAVSAIGNNERFFSSLRSLGCEIIEHPFPDHHPYVMDDFLFNRDAPIIMTEKDAVKCRTLPLENAWFLRVKANLHALTCDEISRNILSLSGTP